ncbi:MAG TPA: gamma-glutamyl-gamma-aminobutyrate hydrolase family protein [Methanosarcina sp.]|nr:gamma-glutamyl-gamma-aminobutyrate hydrolase family protein [Methanosarcina sp.]
MKLASALSTSGHPFNKMGFDEIIPAYKPEDIHGCNALVIWGGADIHPSLYNQPNTHSYVGEGLSSRDAAEWALLQEAIKQDIPIIGVCRGGQMLCAAAGGTLYQHVNNHAWGHHTTKTDDGKVLEVSSLHHQMMNPEGTDYKLMMWSEDALSDKYYDANGEYNKTSIEVEPEYIYFPKIKGHALQWHPEFHSANEACNIWLKERLNEFLK